MAISLIGQPLQIHSAGNDNWWAFSSDLRFAPRFSTKITIKDQNNAIYNTVLVPTNPNNLNVFNIKNIIEDYCVPDFNFAITAATASTYIRQYKLDVTENFSGFYVTASSAAGRVGTCSVIGNTTLKTITVPSLIEEIGFVGGNVTSDPVYVWAFGTASNGYINRINLSSSPTSFVPATASIGSNSEGYVVLANYTVFSDGPTFSTAQKWAVGSNIDWLDYNSTNNYSGYTALNSTSKFLTLSPSELDIQPNEQATLSFIQSLTQSVGQMYVVDNLGGTYSKVISIATASVRIDIPTGTANLSINPNASWYEVSLRNGSTVLSETKRYNIYCLNTRWTPIRLCWLNSLGGVDYYTFKFISQSNKRVERSNFDKQIVYGSTRQDRGITTYRLNDFDQYTVVSNPLDDETSAWLDELFISNEVYWIRAGELIPITLIGDTYDRNVGLETRELQIQFRLARTNRK